MSLSLRLKDCYAGLKKKNLQGLIVFSPANISYLSGFISSDSFFLISPKGNFYFTDSRYLEAAKIGLNNDVSLKMLRSGSAASAIASACISLKITRLGFEEGRVSYLEYHRLRKELGSRVSLKPAQGLIEQVRMVKEEGELAKIRKAVEITLKAFKYIKNRIKPGKEELQIAADLEAYVRYQGASACAFAVIVASGPNSAFAHHQPTSRKIKPGEPVLIDLGVVYQGYKSDLTRVFFSDRIKVQESSVYDIVTEAQRLAIQEVREGVSANKVDASCREYIARSAYGKGLYGHGTGHGIGLEVHEAPSISQNSQTQLKTGMVITIEPAIYLPGKFGIRLEEMVLVTKTGSEVLSGTLNK